jgi:hypothetical protein
MFEVACRRWGQSQGNSADSHLILEAELTTTPTLLQAFLQVHLKKIRCQSTSDSTPLLLLAPTAY